MIDTKYIKEALHLQELTEEEKQKKGILARLYGPCASIVDATRNGRFYSDALWEKVFNENEIVKEMFENGGCPLELDHPSNGREETDSARIAAMLPCAPKRDQDGHLICYVDIIDTPCGKVAYQLAKYGFKLGISSRGSGDVLPDDSVDPDTYDFTTFDLVLLPAVKDARLSMCESLDKNKSKLKNALSESYNSLNSESDKIIMKSVVEDLDIDVDLDADEDDVEDTEVDSPAEPSEQVEEEPKVKTAEDLIKDLEDFDKDTEIEYMPIVINGETYNINGLFVNKVDEDGNTRLMINIDYDSNTGDNIDDVAEDETKAEEIEAEVADDEEAKVEVEEDSEEVIDDESDEVIENLKEAIRHKDALENEVKNLKNEKTVRDAEVKTLSEELNKYKVAFARTSELAAGAKKSEAEVKNLTEQLNNKDAQLKRKDIEISEIKKSRVAQLNESVEAEQKKIKVLTERLNSSKQIIEEKENQLNEQANIYKKKLNECANIAKKYKAQTASILTEYINFRASMLGVRPAEITNKLNESYTLADINHVCDSILESGMPSVSFGLSKSSKVKITESKQNKNEDDGFDDLLELAGLK